MNQGVIGCIGDDENWRDVPGYEGLYSVSSHGRVRSHYFEPPRAVKPCPSQDGYPLVSFNKDGRRHTCLLHRIVCRAFHGEPYYIWNEAAHLDGDRSNPRADNLAWCNKIANHAHKRAHGTHQSGDKAGHRKLNSDQVGVIRAARGKEKAADLAVAFAVSRYAIYDIWQGRRWHEARERRPSANAVKRS